MIRHWIKLEWTALAKVDNKKLHFARCSRAMGLHWLFSLKSHFSAIPSKATGDIFGLNDTQLCYISHTWHCYFCVYICFISAIWKEDWWQKTRIDKLTDICIIWSTILAGFFLLLYFMAALLMLAYNEELFGQCLQLNRWQEIFFILMRQKLWK